MNQDSGQYLVLSGAADFSADSRDRCFWDEQNQRFRLVDDQQPRFGALADAAARSAGEHAAPLVMDRHGQLGCLSADRKQLLYALDWASLDVAVPVLATAEQPDGADADAVSLDPVDAPADTHFTDLHIGGDGRVALPFSNDADRQGLLVVHLAHRWQAHCELSAVARRACVDAQNRIWLASDTTVTLCSGEPLPQAYRAHPDRFEPLQVNPNPLRERWQQTLPAGRELLAMCVDAERLYLLTVETETGRQQLVSRPLNERPDAAWQIHALPEALPFAVDIAAVATRRLALMLPVDPAAPERLDLPVLDLPAGAGDAQLLPRRYPRYSSARPRFTATVKDAAHYLSTQGPKPLLPLPQARYAPDGSAMLNQTLDAGEPGVCWHRIYLEACIPPGCHLQVEAKAFEDFDHEGSDWQRQPAPEWQTAESELPFYAGAYAPEPGRQGVFEILLQRESGAVRDLRGRYLKLRLSMQGDGRHTPAVATLRVYYPRESWQDSYLPELFHQEADVDGSVGPANGADVRGRMLAAFEGVTTPLETRIANAECWLYPMGAPETALPRLAGMLGAQLPAHWPLVRRRRWIQATGQLQRLKGTFAGLCLALDIATDGAVGRSQIVPVENYRLRRTLATILGIDMSDEGNPLTLGTGQSGNSIVGESLILTDEDGREFLALLAPELASSARDRQAVAAFFDHYAYRVSVVIHAAAQAYRSTINDIMRDFLPAHLSWTPIETEHPFVLGLSPLLGIDTYLERRPAWRQIILNDIYLGREGIVRNPAAFDPSQVHVQGERP